MKKILIIGFTLFIVTSILLFGPYQLYPEINEEKALKEFISKDHKFKGHKVIDIDYKGSDTYFVQTRAGEQIKSFIVMRYESSVMNGHWKVFEETSKEQYY
ncbi:hypothetical protein [Pseudalkalibacillus berkeleyi]|uniref:DUF3139 domain-containing protein n=1 Tax=Pseudalkalibacillus berkeleyi TaxID=1069813 RepID=A0ABS9GUS9_9BACL|nr:hypothetical protein [Pseudalkalibacillus berkeleyi]MCF6136587.1 hypothetical protein [Pseudalkalibacillus berkeleyi]